MATPLLTIVPSLRRFLPPSLPPSLQAPRMLELVLVRHGQSEGNVAYRRSLAGDHSLYSGKRGREGERD